MQLSRWYLVPGKGEKHPTQQLFINDILKTLAHAPACPRITVASGHLIPSFPSEVGLAHQHHSHAPDRPAAPGHQSGGEPPAATVSPTPAQACAPGSGGSLHASISNPPGEAPSGSSCFPSAGGERAVHKPLYFKLVGKLSRSTESTFHQAKPNLE